MKTVYLFGASRPLHLSNVSALTEPMAAQTSWPQDVPPILYEDVEQETIEPNDYLEQVKERLLSGGDIDATTKIKIDGETVTIGALLLNIGAWLGAEDLKIAGRIQSGDHRYGATLCLAAQGKEVAYRVPFNKIKGDVASVKMGNVRHALNAKMTDKDILPIVNEMVEQGTVKVASDLKQHGFRHGKSQYVWNKAELVRCYGFTVAEVTSLTDAQVSKAKREEDWAKAIREALNGTAPLPVKAIPGSVLDDLIKMAESHKAAEAVALLKAIRTGERLPVEAWIKSKAVAEG